MRQTRVERQTQEKRGKGGRETETGKEREERGVERQTQ